MIIERMENSKPWNYLGWKSPFVLSLGPRTGFGNCGWRQIRRRAEPPLKDLLSTEELFVHSTRGRRIRSPFPSLCPFSQLTKLPAFTASSLDENFSSLEPGRRAGHKYSSSHTFVAFEKEILSLGFQCFTSSCPLFVSTLFLDVKRDPWGLRIPLPVTPVVQLRLYWTLMGNPVRLLVGQSPSVAGGGTGSSSRSLPTPPFWDSVIPLKGEFDGKQLRILGKGHLRDFFFFHLLYCTKGKC